MFAVVSRSSDPPPRLEATTPTPLGPTDIRVQVAAAGFTLFDAFSAANHDILGLPDVIGHGFDFSGTVTEIGSEVHMVVPGQLVAGLHADAAATARAHATEVVVPETNVALVPEGLSPDQAATVPLNALTARQSLDLLGAERGRLLVTGGAGSIGTWVIALAKLDGWHVDALTRPGSESIAREAGAVEVVTQLPGPNYDAVVDAAAIGGDALNDVVDHGRYVSLKPGRAPEMTRNIVVSTVFHQPDGAMLAQLLRLAAEGAVPIRIAAIRPLSSVAETYAEATSAPGSAGRWLLVP